METETSLVRADSAVELDTITEVSLNFSLVVYPSYTESEDTVWLDHSLNDFCLFKFRMLVINLLDRLENFLNGLKVLIFTRMLCSQVSHYFSCFHISMNVLKNWFVIV